MDQEARYSLAGCLWLKISLEAAIWVWAGAINISKFEWEEIHFQVHSQGSWQPLVLIGSWVSSITCGLLGRAATTWQLASLRASEPSAGTHSFCNLILEATSPHFCVLLFLGIYLWGIGSKILPETKSKWGLGNKALLYTGSFAFPHMYSFMHLSPYCPAIICSPNFVTPFLALGCQGAV